jgi:SusD family.
MKKIFYISVILLSMWSCSGFLDEVDQDKLIPEKTDHYAALLLNEFNFEYPIFKDIDYMTDNMVEDASALTSNKFNVKTTYTWQREIEIDEEGNILRGKNSTWENMYEDIAVANYVLELIDEAEGEESEIKHIKGEAYFIRALSYFNLLNLYGQPFNTGTANVDLGVALRDNIGVELSYSRNSVAECYAFIEKELTTARQLIGESNIEKTIWHPNVYACDLLMSRVKLYQEKWDEAISYANKVIDGNSLSNMTVNAPFVKESNDEILYSYYTASPLLPLYRHSDNLSSAYYNANPELYSMYDDEDKRKEVFFAPVDDGTGRFVYRTKKYQKGLYTELGFANLRVAEAYLNRAEAYAHKGDVSNAVNDIKTLHASRYSDVSVVVYPNEPVEVINFVLNERRKELCFEDHHRWFDLRRMKNRPEIKHVFTLIEDDGSKLGTETYTLLSDDLNYTLPIPLEERENNPLIRNNERYEKIPVIDDEIIIP